MTDTPKAIARTFRDRLRDEWSPPWLSYAFSNNERFMYAFGLVVDVLGDALAQGMASRFPGVAGYESLPIIGRERRIARGPYETNRGYALRLRRWLDDHRRRGGAWALLAQIHAYYAPNNFPVELIYRSGRHYVMAPDGTVTRGYSPSFAPDANPAMWARWYLYYTTDEYDVDDLSADDVADLRHVPREWNAAHAIGAVVVMQPGAELYNWPLGRKYNRPGVKYNRPGRSAKVAVDHA